ncbi:MAG: hypothetical protein WDZ45_06715 [Flavobacteriaceae bacterium]
MENQQLTSVVYLLCYLKQRYYGTKQVKQQASAQKSCAETG